MRGSTGVSTGGPDPPPPHSRMEKHKAVDWLEKYKATDAASEAPLI